MTVSKKSNTKDYRSLSAELDAVLLKLEDGDLSVDEAMQAYERGMELVQQLEVHLAKAENQITKLRKQFEGGV